MPSLNLILRHPGEKGQGQSRKEEGSEGREVNLRWNKNLQLIISEGFDSSADCRRSEEEDGDANSSSPLSSSRGKRGRENDEQEQDSGPELFSIPLRRILNHSLGEEFVTKGAGASVRRLLVLRLTFIPEKVKAANFSELRDIQDLQLYCDSDLDSPNGATLQQLDAELTNILAPNGDVNVTAFVSPVSGAGKAVNLWNKIGVPILKRSRHSFTTVVTTHRLHAQEYVENPKTYSYRPGVDVVVAAGGDGMMFEVINGLKRRQLKNASKNGYIGPFKCSCPVLQEKEGTVLMDDSLPELPDLSDLGGADALPKFATFACGSGCGLATGLDVLDLVQAVLSVTQGTSVTMDLLCSQEVPTVRQAPTSKKGGLLSWLGLGGKNKQQEVKHEISDPLSKFKNGEPKKEKEASDDVEVFGSGAPIWSFLAFQFAVSAEIDKQSEMFRFLGNARFGAYAISLLVTGVPVYPLTVKYVPWKDGDDDGDTTSGGATSTTTTTTAGGSSSPRHDWGSQGDEMPASLINYQAERCTMDMNCYCQRHNREKEKSKKETTKKENSRGAAAPTADDTWLTYPVEKCWFGSVSCNPYLTQDSLFAPFAHIGSSAIDMTIATGASATRWRFLKTFLNTERGDQVLPPTDEELARGVPRDWYCTKAKKVLVQPQTGLIGPDGEYGPCQPSGFYMEKERNGVHFIRSYLPGGHRWPKPNK